MIYLYQEAGRLYISRRGRIASIEFIDDRIVKQLLKRLENEGRISTLQTREAFFEAHALALT